MVYILRALSLEPCEFPDRTGAPGSSGSQHDDGNLPDDMFRLGYLRLVSAVSRAAELYGIDFAAHDYQVVSLETHPELMIFS